MSPEVQKDTVHKILFIESEIIQVEQSIELLAYYGQLEGLKVSESDITARPYPPEDEKEFKRLLSENTGAILHNLTPTDLDIISRYVDENPDIAQTLVVVKTGGTITDELDIRYQILQNKGVTLTRKPFSLQPAAKIIFGIK